MTTTDLAALALALITWHLTRTLLHFLKSAT